MANQQVYKLHRIKFFNIKINAINCIAADQDNNQLALSRYSIRLRATVNVHILSFHVESRSTIHMFLFLYSIATFEGVYYSCTV